MPIEWRDWYRGNHPPSCSCAECTKKRLGKSPEITSIFSSETLLPTDQKCPVCGETLYVGKSDLLWRCKNSNCRRIYTHKDLFSEKIDKPQEEKENVPEVRPSVQPQAPSEVVRQSVADRHLASDEAKMLQQSAETKREEGIEERAKRMKRESMDEFITRLLYKKNSWDVSIVDLLVVSFAIFVMLMLYIIFLG